MANEGVPANQGAPPPPPPLFAEVLQGDAYPGESEDLDYLEALLSGAEQPELSDVLEPLEKELARRYVKSLTNQENLDVLEGYLESGEWEQLLKHLLAMVDAGYADKAVEDEDARDMYRAHPELVLVIRRQRYTDLRRSEEIHVANDYYRESVLAHYPEGTSSGVAFVDRTVLQGLRMLSRSVGNPPEDAAAHRARTRQAVRDYLRLYFPAYRPNVEDSTATRSRVWELGERLGKDGRCLACHRLFRSLNATMLREHLGEERSRRVGKCPAVTEHVRRRLRDIVDEAEEGA